MKFLSRCLSTSPVPPAAPQIKPLSEALAGLLEDSFEGARNEAAICLGTLMKIVGERPLNAIMDQLAEVRKVKVKEAFEKATVKCKGGSGAATRAPPSKAPAKTAPSSMKPQVATSNSEEALMNDAAPPRPKAKPPARLMAKKALADEAPTAEAPSAVEPPKPAAKAPARLMVSWSASFYEIILSHLDTTASQKAFPSCSSRGCCRCVVIEGSETRTRST